MDRRRSSTACSPSDGYTQSFASQSGKRLAVQPHPMTDALSDPPPPSDRTSNRRSSLAPQNSNRSEHRPSSRRALTRALELAREAVQLDSTNDNPVAAVNAYAQSVALLSEVMERVRSGEDSTDPHRRRQRRSVSAQEKEVRRLQNIVSLHFNRYMNNYPDRLL